MATMKVCRVCLATNVKMYHMSEHKLGVMFERVTGVEIKTEDKLPQMLCWECVARLSSANHFIEKTFKTQFILKNYIRNKKSITISDIESIDKDGNRLKSSLGYKFYKDNYSDIHIFENIVDAANIKTENEYFEGQIGIKEEFTESNESCHNDNKIEIHCESVKVDFDEETRDAEYFETAETEFDYNTESAVFCENKEFNLSDKFKIQSDPLEITEHQIGVSSGKTAEDTASKGKGKIKCNINDETNQEVALDNESDSEDAESQIVEVTKEFLFNNSTQQKRGNQSSTQSHPKKLKVIEDTDLSNSGTLDFYQQFMYKGLTTKNNETAGNPDSKDTIHPSCRTSDPGNTSQLASVRTNTNNNNSDDKVKHTKTPLLHCTYCNYEARKKAHLNEHINSKHTKKVAFNCSFCTFKTFRERYLREHINGKHTKTFSFNCSHCDYKAYIKSTLEKHVADKHTEKNLTNCTLCDFDLLLRPKRLS